MRLLIQKNNFISGLAYLALLLVAMTFLVVPAAHAAATAKWSKDGTLTYKGTKYYLKNDLSSTDHSSNNSTFVPKSQRNSDCPTEELFFSKGSSYKTAKKVYYLTQKADDFYQCLPTSSPSPVKITNKYQGGVVENNDGALPGGSSGGGSPGPCDETSSFKPDPAYCGTTTTAKSFIKKYVNPFVKVGAVLAGIAVVIGILWGAISYVLAGGDPQKVAEAKGKIQKALIGLVTFILLYSLVNWLVPGGV